MTADSTGPARAAGSAQAPAGTPLPGRAAPVRSSRTYGTGRPARWQRHTYAFGRIAVSAIALFALLAALLHRSSAAFSVDPTTYAGYLATGRWQAREALATIGLGATGVLSIVGLAALLMRGHARGIAIAGLVTALAGTTGMVLSVGSVVIREDRVRHAVLRWHWSQLAFTAHTTGSRAALMVVGGALLLSIGWILLGIAVVRTPGMNRADGPLLMISAPLVYLGGMILHVLPTMGSFLLLAAGLGIVFTADRVAVDGDPNRRRWHAASPAMTPEASKPEADPSAGSPAARQ